MKNSLHIYTNDLRKIAEIISSVFNSVSPDKMLLNGHSVQPRSMNYWTQHQVYRTFTYSTEEVLRFLQVIWSSNE